MTHYGITTDYEYSSTHKRERLQVWSGGFMSEFEGEALSLPNGAGYMVTTYNGDKVRVSCPSPRTDANYQEVDKAIADALNAHHEPASVEGGVIVCAPGTLTLEDLAAHQAEYNEPAPLVSAQYSYREGELSQVDATGEYPAKIQITSDGGSTKHLSITATEFEQIKMVLLDYRTK